MVNSLAVLAVPKVHLEIGQALVRTGGIQLQRTGLVTVILAKSKAGGHLSGTVCTFQAPVWLGVQPS